MKIRAKSILKPISAASSASFKSHFNEKHSQRSFQPSVRVALNADGSNHAQPPRIAPHLVRFELPDAGEGVFRDQPEKALRILREFAA